MLLLEGLVENTSTAHADYVNLKMGLAKMKEVTGSLQLLINFFTISVYVNERKREAEAIHEVLSVQDKLMGDVEV